MKVNNKQGIYEAKVSYSGAVLSISIPIEISDKLNLEKGEKVLVKIQKAIA